jgi:uncharacterized linocin/CFP29 family protein
MNHLNRELAPVTDSAWAQIDDEASRSLKQYLAARRLTDFEGPLGWDHSSVDLGRVESLPNAPIDGVECARRLVRPLVEFRVPFSLSRSELAAAERGATDLNLNSVIAASRSAALTEDGAIFHGFQSGAIAGIAESSPHELVTIDDDYSRFPEHAAKAVAILRATDIAGPYAIALGARCFTGVTETTERGGYPVLEHLREILGGPVVWAPAVEGAVIVSQRGGDYKLTVGQDFSVGYHLSDATLVQFYIEESFTFQINTPEAAVGLSNR